MGTNKEANFELINLFEHNLRRYKDSLNKDPESLFYKGMVKNTEEFLIELKTVGKINLETNVTNNLYSKEELHDAVIQACAGVIAGLLKTPSDVQQWLDKFYK